MNHDYLVTGPSTGSGQAEITAIRENGASSGGGVLATYAYDDLGRRTSLTFGNGALQAFAYDPVSRLASLTNDLTGTTNDLSATFAYNPASQIASTVRTGDAYAWTGHFNENKAGTPNGLNQLTAVGAKSLTHDSKGNVTAFGTKAFTYSSENLLKTGPGSTALSHDPAMRLYQTVSGAATSRFAYDGLDRIAEYDGSNALQRRYVHGPAMDEPLVWYEGSGTTDRRFLSSDERGSIVSVTDSTGAVLGLNRYDEYGQPQSTNIGAFGYTGQAWLPSVGVWYYKARVYDSELGRFLQPDPIGYAGGPNLYAGMGGDPVNLTDPSGLSSCSGTRLCNAGSYLGVGQSGFSTGGVGGVAMGGIGGGGDAGGGGGGGSGGGGFVGGPLHGSTSCPGCIGAGSSGVARSIAHWGGYYDRGSWVSVGGFGGSGFDLAGANFYQTGMADDPAMFHQAGIRPPGGRAGVVKEVLRQAFMKAMPKIPFPKNAAGLSPAEFGRMAGFRQNDVWRSFSESEVQAAVNRLRSTGVLRQDVVNAADFYSYNAFRDIGNEAAAFRSYYLQQVARSW